MCVCEGGGGIVFDLDSVRCEPRTHGIESQVFLVTICFDKIFAGLS